MSKVLAIDPGDKLSAYVVTHDDHEIIRSDKIPNEHLLVMILTGSSQIDSDVQAIEMVTSYGMRVGREVFETCVWIGRFTEAIRASWWPHSEPLLIPRADVKLHICGKRAATDADIRAALKERFGDKGTKAQPGWFYGVTADRWQAYALAVLVNDQHLRQTSRFEDVTA